MADSKLVSIQLDVQDEDVARIKAMSQILASDTEASRRLRAKIEEILRGTPLEVPKRTAGT
jgi:hypothetical protein